MVKTIKLNLLFELLFIFLAALILTVTVLLFFSSLKVVSSVGQESNPLGNLGIGETAPSDTTPPSVSVTNPLDGVSVSGIVNVTADASDSSGIAKVEFYADTDMIGTSSSAPYFSGWDTTVYPHNSLHLVHARAFDLANNVASSSGVFVTVLDITAPSVTITNPANGSTVPKNSIVTIQASASDVSGINKVEFYVNGILKCTDTTSAYSCNWKVPKRPNITYTLLAKTFDVAGNTSTSTVTVTSK